MMNYEVFAKCLQNRKRVIAALLFFAAQSITALGEIIPAERRVDWTLAGVPGGIPIRTNIFCNVRVSIPGSTNIAYGDGIHDDYDAIYDAINLCKSNQVVYLPAGTYRIAKGRLYFPFEEYFTIRGAGASTVIKVELNGAADSCFLFGSVANPTADQIMSVTGGAVKGSTNITVSANNSGAVMGKFLMINQLNGGEVCATNQDGQACTYCDRDMNGTRNFQQIVRLTAVNGTSLTFWPPLNRTFDGQAVQATYISSVIRKVGVEDLKIQSANQNALYHFFFVYADQCWIKNVESYQAPGWHMMFYRTVQCEVRDNYLREAFMYTVNRGYGFEGRWCYGLLFQNNIMEHLYASFILCAGSSGSVVGYNLIVNSWNSDPTYQICSYQANHGAHPTMNLYEGNIGPEFQADWNWGSGSHQVLFRNWFQGKDIQTTYNLKSIAIDRGNLHYTVVGNILGCTNVPNWVYSTTNNGFTFPVIYRLGYPYMGNNGYGTSPWYSSLDTNVEATLLRHGNYDYATKSVVWDKSISDQAIPNSLYLANKPSWFGNLAWPAFDPMNPNPALDLIPAGYRYMHGVNPPSSGGDQSPAIITQPANQTVTVGQTATFTVAATGTAPLKYQWKKSGTNLGGATNASYTTPATVLGDNGAVFAVVVSNSVGMVTSSGATLTVNAPVPAAPRNLDIVNDQ